MDEITEQASVADLVADWRSAGLVEGDTVLVHSSVKRTCARGYTPADIVRSLLDTVGPEGTVLFPLFNFAFCSGDPFDIRASTSRMGALTEAARAHPQVVRTGHPAYSFAVIGSHANKFKGLFNKSGYGEDSPFAMLREMHGKIAVLDLEGQHSMTFYHHIEQMHNVPYRYHKEFHTDYTDYDGVSHPETFSIFVRDLENDVLTDVNPMDERLWQHGLYSGCRHNEGHGMRVISAREMYDAVSEVIKKGDAEGVLFSYGKRA